MEFITRPIERWLWPSRGQRPATVSRWRILARYAYALLRDLGHGDLSLRAMSLVYTTMVAIVPLLAFAFALIKGLGLHRDFEPLLLGFLTPLGPQATVLTQRIVGFVDNVSGLALGSLGIAILLFSALSMAQKVEGSFNFVWRVDRPRSFARRFSEYLSVMLLGPLVMSVVMGFTAILGSTAAVERLSALPFVGGWLAGLGSLLPYALIIASFAFLYVFAIGRRLRGSLCGFFAVMVLFVYEPLLFVHGLRNNNMEAPLVLAYCGAIYHYLQWSTAATASKRWLHVLAASLFTRFRSRQEHSFAEKVLSAMRHKFGGHVLAISRAAAIPAKEHFIACLEGRQDDLRTLVN